MVSSKTHMIDFFKKHYGNILFVLFALYLFSPYGLPVRALLIKGVSKVTTIVFDMKIEETEREAVDFDESWNLLTADGEEQTLSSLKGQVVVVNYWATWCPPCVAEMPSMQSLYEAYEGKVAFLFVARDEPVKVEQFLKKNAYTFPVFYELNAPPSAMRSNSLPTTFILDKNGKIAAKKVGAADWNSSRVHNLLDGLLK